MRGLDGKKVFFLKGRIMKAQADAGSILWSEYLRALAKRKKTIAFIFSVTVLITVVRVAFEPRLFEAKAAVDFGSLLNGMRTRAEIIQSLKSDKFLESLSNSMDGRVPASDLRKMLEDKRLTIWEHSNYLTFIMLDHDPALAEGVLQNMAKLFIEKRDAEQATYLDLVQERLSMLTTSKKDVLDQIAGLRSTLQPNDVREKYELLRFYEDSSRQLDRDILSAKEILLSVRPFTVNSKAAVSKRPVKPEVAAQIGFACIVGLLGGFFVAWLEEFWVRI